MPHIPGRPNEGHQYALPKIPFNHGDHDDFSNMTRFFPSAEGILTSPSDLDLGMVEALGGGTSTWTGSPTAGPSLAGPLGPAPAPGSSDPAWWNNLTETPSTSIGWDMQDAATRAGVYRDTNETGGGFLSDLQNALGIIGGGVQKAVTAPWNVAQAGVDAVSDFFEEPSVWTGERPTLLEGRGLGLAQQQVYALGGTPSEAERFMTELQVAGNESEALRFAEIYAEETGVDLMDVTFDPSAPTYDAAGDMTPAATFAEMSTADRAEFQTWYNSPAVQDHYSISTGYGEAEAITGSILKDFKAVQHFVSTLPSAAEVETQAKKDVTQAEVDAYLKELDAMSDEDYNQIAKNLGLSPATYKTDGVTADKKFLEEGNIRAHETGSGFGFDPSSDPFSTFSIDHDLILAQVAAAKTEEAAATAAADEAVTVTDGEDDAVVSIDDQINEIFAGRVTQPQHDALRTRMAELGTTDLTQAIRDEFATITTPDYSADILQRYDEMGTALSDAAAERTRVLEETTTRAEGRIGDIKTGLKSELEEFEIGRVEQQTAIEQGVVDRTTKMETDLVDRLDDIRVALGDQVTSEFEEVAALAGTLTSSQATSSRDAISRLTQIGNMAATARLSAPAEMSAEALTALSELEFKVENEIAQGLADSQAQVQMQKASALLQETMRRGEFETQQQRALVESVLQETLRGTVYEDRTKEMLAQALMQEDQYVRQFNEGVDQQLAGAQLQNLFGTQDYQRQLDMMNLTRDWQTADALQGREWQVSDMLQGRAWQTDDMTTTRGWQEADYLKALTDQRTDQLTARGWDLADAKAAAAADAAAALAAQPDMTKVLNRMRSEFPDVPDQLYAVAMHVKDMDFNPPMADAKVEGPDWVPPEGFRGEYHPIGGANPGWLVTEQLGDSEAEIYLKSLTEGAVLSVDEVTGRTERGPAMTAKDAGSLRAMIDFALEFDTRSDVMEEITGLSDAELELWLIEQGVGGATPWDPVGGSNVGAYRSSATSTGGGSSNLDILQNMLTAGQVLSGPQGWASLAAGQAGSWIKDRLPWG